MTTFRCKKCGHEHVITSNDVFRPASKAYKSSGYPAQTFVGDGADTLRQTHPPAQRQAPHLPTWTQGSRTGMRVMQTSASCGLVYLISGSPVAAGVTGLAVWFGSLLGGQENWGVVHRFLDRNHDGKLNRKDIEHVVNSTLDNVLEPDDDTPPDIPVHVIRGNETVMGVITRATQEQLTEAARVMFSVVNQGKAFSRDRVGGIFGNNFSQVQKEMIKLKLLEGNRHAGYKLTNEGKTFLSRYHPSPTPNEVE